MKSTLMKFWADETAATAIEYGLIAAGISLAIFSRERAWHQPQDRIHLDQHIAALATHDPEKCVAVFLATNAMRRAEIMRKNQAR